MVSVRALALISSLVALATGDLAGAQQITVVPQGQFVFEAPISPVQFTPGLKFQFTTEARAAKVRVELEISSGPSGKEGVAFSFPETDQRWVEINSYQTDLAIQVPDGALPGAYSGRLVFHVEPKEIVIAPSEVRFAFSLVEPTLSLTWAKDPGSTIRLGTISTGELDDYVGPQFTVEMDDVMASGSKLNFNAEDSYLWIKGATGEPQKGIGALGPGTYTVMLDPSTPTGKYAGALTFSVLSVGTKINGQSGPLEYEYSFDVTNPLLTILKLVGAVVLIGLITVAAGVMKKQMAQQKKAGGKPLVVEGTLEFIVPMERRPEKLERVGKPRVVFGDKGDLLKDVRRINFELAGFIRDGKKVMELTQLKGSCPVYLNGSNTFTAEIYDGDLLKFGEYPTFEVRFRHPELVRAGGPTYGQVEEEASVKASHHEPESRQPIGLATSSDDDGQLESLSGEVRPMTQSSANRDMASAMSDALASAKGGMELDLDAPAPTTSKGSKSTDLDLSLDLDLDIEPQSETPAKGDKKKGEKSIDLPDGFDLLGDS